MGQKITIPYRKKEKWIKEHCLHCEDFLDRHVHAIMIENLGMSAGKWDFETCYSTCWRDIKSL